MKTTLLAAAAALSLAAATAAHAGEGLGEPFPFRAPGLTTTVQPNAYATDTGAAAYPDLTGRPSQRASAGDGPDGMPVTGSEGSVQTANSLPRGFQDGTAAYAYAQSANRYFAERAGRARLAAERLAGASRG